MEFVLYGFLGFIFGAIVSGFIFFIKLTAEKKKNLELQKEIFEKNAKIEANKLIKDNEETIYNLIKKEFTNSANEILIEKQKNLQEQNLISLEGFLNPLKEKIKEFQVKVEAADETNKINCATLKQQIEDLIKQNQINMQTTEKLSLAISQNSKFRGSLGEMILEKLLKSSGLIDKKENPKFGNYETQVCFKSLDGSSGAKIVDAVIYLGEGTKSVVVDSKAPLSEFLDYMEEEDEQIKQKHMSQFLNDVYDRIRELSGKYTNLEGLNTPDFTVMFIPFEYPLTFIYSNNKLIEDALKENIIIAGPSTLIAILRTVSYLWANKNQYDNIKDIIKLSAAIYDKFVTFISKIEGVQTSFDTLRKKFDELIKTAKGKGGLIGQVEKLKDYGLIPSKQIEQKYLEETYESIGEN